MSRGSGVVRLRLVALAAVLIGLATACDIDDVDRCDEGQEYRDGACFAAEDPRYSLSS